MVRFRRRLALVPLCMAALVLGAASSAQAASATRLSPGDGASVTVVPTPGFANGPLPLSWRVEYAGCPGSDDIHVSAPETRPAGAGDTDWQGHVSGGPFYGPGAFTTTMTLFPSDVPQQYEWRVRWNCGATSGYAGEWGYSSVGTFTLLPKSVPLTVRPVGSTPKQPKAGSPLTFRIGVFDKATGRPVTAGLLLCKLTVGGKAVPRFARAIVEGAAHCKWRIPKSARGKQVRGSITVVLHGERAVHSFTRRVSL